MFGLGESSKLNEWKNGNLNLSELSLDDQFTANELMDDALDKKKNIGGLAFSAGSGTGPSWSLDGMKDSIAGAFGTDVKTLDGLTGLAGSAFGLGSTLFDAYNKNKMFDLAKDNYAFQKSMTEKQWNEAMKDKAEFKANQAKATKAYYGQG